MQAAGAELEVGVLANKGRKAKASSLGERAARGTGLPRGLSAQSPPSPFPALTPAAPSSAEVARLLEDS